MAKKADIARELITPRLEAGEQLQAVGSFRSGAFWAMMLLSELFSFAIKYYYMGVTNRTPYHRPHQWLGENQWMKAAQRYRYPR